ncbi:hypothetical protein Bca4012_008100 [Brassica carinata]
MKEKKKKKKKGRELFCIFKIFRIWVKDELEVSHQFRHRRWWPSQISLDNKAVLNLMVWTSLPSKQHQSM